jgi:hypothetical protein
MYINPLFKGKIRFPPLEERHLLLCFSTIGSLDSLLQLFFFFSRISVVILHFGALELTLLAGWIPVLKHCLALRVSTGALKLFWLCARAECLGRKLVAPFKLNFDGLTCLFP